MALTTNASYAPTMSEFIDHWTDVNTERGEGVPPLILRTGKNVTDLDNSKIALLALEVELQEQLNDGEVARAAINREKRALLKWFGRFMEVFYAYFGNSDLAGARPLAPGVSVATQNFLRPMIDAADLWRRIDAGPSVGGLLVPVTLTGDTAGDTLTLAQFNALFVELRESADDETLAISRARQERSRRSHLQKDIHDGLRLYRQSMPSALPASNPLQDTLPRLTPEPGHTPDPVNASAIWVEESTSKTVYAASDDPQLKHYQLRGVIGLEWNDEDAVVLATNEPEDAREFVVSFGLTQPGTHIVLKVYVITQDGNERGSAPLPVQRPEVP